MARVLVTLGSDNTLDWVQTPDGQKFSLGSVPVARFLAALTPASGLRRALDSFLMYGEVVASVDLDQMWELLKPIRARFGSDSPFITPFEREARNQPMSQFEANLRAAEQALSILAKKVASGHADVPKALATFVTAANKIKSPNQSKNQTYYGLGEPDVYEVGDASPKVEEAPTAKSAGMKLAYDTLQENQTVAGEILASLEEIDSRIASLVGEGKKFNAARARADLHAVSSKVAGILRDVDLTQPWVAGDLTKLAARTKQLHGIFFPKS